MTVELWALETSPNRSHKVKRGNSRQVARIEIYNFRGIKDAAQRDALLTVAKGLRG